MARAKAKNDGGGGDLTAIRSLLFLPASNPRAIAKARAAGADLVILDLEDAVKRDDKSAARDAAVEAVGGPWPMPVAIRINSVGTQWHAADVEAVARSNADLLVVPRATSPELIADIARAAAKPILAMIETAAGILAAPAIARACTGLIAGTNDLAADLRLPPGAGRAPLHTSLQLIVLAARAAGIAAFDGVFNRLDDTDAFLAEAADGRQLGFDGKSLIHPNQIALCHRAFAPTAGEIERATALVGAFTGGAERFGDEMIEQMHIDAARRLLARAGCPT